MNKSRHAILSSSRIRLSWTFMALLMGYTLVPVENRFPSLLHITAEVVDATGVR